jgi:hypothetical protein
MFAHAVLKQVKLNGQPDSYFRNQENQKGAGLTPAPFFYVAKKSILLTIEEILLADIDCIGYFPFRSISIHRYEIAAKADT